MKKFTSKKAICPLFSMHPGDAVDQHIPEDVKYAFILMNGRLWSYNHTPLHTSLAPCAVDKQEQLLKPFEISAYDPTKIYLIKEHWKEYKFDINDFKYVMAYFRKIYDKHETEAAVLLMVNYTTKNWKVLFIPQVDCSGGGVNYIYPRMDGNNLEGREAERFKDFMKIEGNPELMQKCVDQMKQLTQEGYKVFGTIHSHCNFGAYHSNVDDADEIHFDGLHITIGNVRSDWSFSARMAVAGQYFKIDIFDIFGFKLEDVKENIDAIEVLDEHMQLMQPDVGKFLVPPQTQQVVSFYNGSSQNRYYQQGGSVDWDNYPLFNQNEKSKTDELLDNICYFSGGIHLYDLKEGEGLVVRSRYYYMHKDQFPESRFIKVDDPEYPEDLINQHNQFKLELETISEIEEDEDDEYSKTLFLLYDKRLGSGHQAKIGQGEKIQDIETFKKNHKKATKINRGSK